MSLDVTNKYIVTGGQDKKLKIWYVDNGKSYRTYKLGSDTGEPIKV